ncbi:nucleoside monophosphate kinase [Patescibacteria group bacterium]|nr:nucleoside monophosphate kinase [Patescibacteria group bacterium]
MNIVIFGPQGSGKGTQARLLVDKFGLFHFESGKFLRKLAKKDRHIDEIINKRGKLIEDGKMFSYMSSYLEKKVNTEGVLLDGYPRSITQYELLKEWLKERGTKVDRAIFLDISEKESVRRLSARRISKKTGKIYNLVTNPPPSDGGKLIQRPDDKPAAIRKRLALYKQTTEPLIKVFEKEGVLMKIDGERPIDMIFKDIVDRLIVNDGKRENKN